MARTKKAQHLYRLKPGGVFYGWYYDPTGKQVRRSTGCIDPQAAAAKLAEWERDAQDTQGAARKGYTLGDCIDALLSDRTSKAAAKARALDAGKQVDLQGSDQTVKFYGHAFQPVLLFAGRVMEGAGKSKVKDNDLPIKERERLRELGRTFPLSRVDRAFADALVEHRRMCGVSEHYIAKSRQVLKSALKLARVRGLWTGDLDSVLPSGFRTGYTPRKTWLELPQVFRLLDALGTMPNVSKARLAQVAWMVMCGGEWAAVKNARKGDLRKGMQEVLVRGSKNNYRTRTVPLVCTWQQELLQVVLDNIGEGGEGDALFPAWSNVHRCLTLAAQKAGIPHVSPHSLRHTCAHLMLNDGVGELEVAAVLGHRDTSMVSRIYGRPEGAELAHRMRARLADRRAALRLVKSA